METFDTSARIAVLENELKNVTRVVQEHRDDSKEQHRQIMEKISNIDSRLTIIERWRWMVVGGAVALGYALPHLFKLLT